MWTIPPRRIVVAVDFGDASARAVALGALLARRFGAHLTCLHAEAIEVPPYFSPSQIALIEQERSDWRQRAEGFVRDFCAHHGGQAIEDVRVVEAPPCDAILHAGEEADLIVLGTHGRRGPRRWWLGSVAERVVRDATVPTMVVHAASVVPSAAAGGLVVTSEADGPAQTWAEQLTAALAVPFERVTDVTACSAAAAAGASVVVVQAPPVSGHRLGEPLVRLLRTCEQTVLFVPNRPREDAS